MNTDQILHINVVGILVGWVATIASIFVAYLVDYVFSGWELAAVFTSYVCTFLCVMQTRTNYLWGIVTVALYCKVFYDGALYASAATQVYLSGAIIYGWFRWKSDETPRPVRKTPLNLGGIYFLATMLTYIGATLITSWFGGSLPFMDSAILALTILAQFLLDNKRLENWYVWILVNLMSIALYWESGLYLVVFQYVIFLANTLFGLYMWKKSMNRWAVQ